MMWLKFTTENGPIRVNMSLCKSYAENNINQGCELYMQSGIYYVKEKLTEIDDALTNGKSPMRISGWS